LFTPAGNKSSVVCFYTTQPQTAVRAAFSNAKIDVTVRENHVRVSFALFNTADDVDAALVVTKTLT